MSQTISLWNELSDTPNIFEENAEGKLKPCPFCGRSESHFQTDDELGLIWVRCGQCGAEGPFRDTRLTAMKAWNKRG